MKYKTTKKAIREMGDPVYCVGYCNLQHLLREFDPFAYSTNAFRTCKEAIAALQEKLSVTVAGIPDYTITVKPEDKITAYFAKR